MRNSNIFEQNERMLIEAFNAQNIEAYDETLQKLEYVGDRLIEMVEGIEKNTQFYMRVMPILKQERELVSEKEYKEFIHKNQKVLSKNFQQNAYFALLMQEMEHKNQKESKKWGIKEENQLNKMIAQSYNFQEIYEKFSDFELKQVKRKYQKIIKKQGVLSSTEQKQKK